MPHRHASRGPASARRAIAGLCAVVALISLLAVAAPGGAGAQTSSTTAAAPTTAPAGGGAATFPADTFAVVPPASTDPPLSLGAVYRVTGTSDDNPTIAVQFREAFELPTDAPYRVSVLVGNPTARRLRSSMIVQSGKPTGRAEVGDGESFEQLGPVPPPTADPSGVIAISVPVNEAPSGGALWVEAVYGDAVAISPYYSLDAVLARAADGKVAASPFGRVAEADGGPSDVTATMPAGPRLTVVNTSVILESTTPTPSDLLDQPVTSAVDTIVIAPDFNDEAAVTDEIRIDRTTGTIHLIDNSTDPPSDRSTANQTWIVEGLGDDPMAPGKVVFDLEAVSDALGITADGVAPALGVQRTFELADGKTVMADAVLASSSWFAANAVVESTSPPTVAVSTPASDDTTSSWVLPAAIGGAALVLVLLSIVVMLRRRRAGVDAADVLGAMAAEVEEERRTQQHAAVSLEEPAATAAATGLPVTAVRTGELPVLPDQQPVIVTVEDIEQGRVAAPAEPAAPEPAAAPVAPTAPEPAAEPAAPESTAEPAPPEAAEPAAPRSADQAGPGSLAALDSELDELTARLAALEEPPES